MSLGRASSCITVVASWSDRPFGGDPDRLARFQREARVLASLGIEEAEGTRALGAPLGHERDWWLMQTR